MWYVVLLFLFSGCVNAAPVFAPNATLEVTSVPEGVALSWPIPQGEVKKYNVFVDEKLQATASENRVVVTGLKPWRQVRFGVNAVSASGETSQFLHAEFRVADTQKPTFSLNTAIEWSKDEKSLSWPAIVDDGELSLLRVTHRLKEVARLPPETTTWTPSSWKTGDAFILRACDAAENCLAVSIPQKPSDIVLAKLNAVHRIARLQGKESELRGVGILGGPDQGSGIDELFRYTDSKPSGLEAGLGIGRLASDAKLAKKKSPTQVQGVPKLKLQLTGFASLDERRTIPILRRRISFFRSCAKPWMTGTWQAKVNVDKNGRAKVKTTQSLKDDDVNKCLKKIVEHARFPWPNSPGHFEISLVFKR